MLYRMAVFQAKPTLIEESKAFQSAAKQRMAALGPVDHMVLQSMTDPTQFSQLISFEDEGALFRYLESDELKSLQTDPNGVNLWGDRTKPFVVDRYRRID